MTGIDWSKVPLRPCDYCGGSGTQANSNRRGVRLPGVRTCQVCRGSKVGPGWKKWEAMKAAGLA